MNFDWQTYILWGSTGFFFGFAIILGFLLTKQAVSVKKSLFFMLTCVFAYLTYLLLGELLGPIFVDTFNGDLNVVHPLIPFLLSWFVAYIAPIMIFVFAVFLIALGFHYFLMTISKKQFICLLLFEGILAAVLTIIGLSPYADILPLNSNGGSFHGNYLALITIALGLIIATKKNKSKTI